MALSEFEAFDSDAAAKRNLKAAIEKVAARLGNTPTICRRCYVHPEIMNGYLSGDVLLDIQEEVEEELRERLRALRPEEAAVLSLLKSRIARETGSSTLKAD